ncbi:MAG: petC [Gammaproteobacteria bacterium]|nr:petC [Gammaproteobacteria bacterium]
MALISRASNDSYFVNDLALDATDKPSLQRGAQIYFNYCNGCHSLHYEHYSKLGHAIGVEDPTHRLYTDLIQKSLLFNLHGDIHAYIESHMQPEDAKKWFGVIPPDLTNITATKSPAWVYNFLRAFYRDDSKAFGYNNVIAPNTAMPNVLQPLRGETQAVWNNQQFDHFVTTKSGELKPLEFDHAMYDLVNFLNLISEPQQMLRIWIGICILAFLAILLLMVYFWVKSTQPESKDSEST